MARRANAMKLQEWIDRLDRYRRSGQSVAAFCRDEGVSGPSFYKWRRKLSQAEGGTPRAASRFKPVQLTAETSAPVMTVRLPTGASIEVTCDVELAGEVVDRVLAAHARAPESC